jgi:hypothetical protein
MASRSDVERFAQTADDIRRLAIRDLQRSLTVVDTASPQALADAVQEIMPRLVATYGDVAAAAAADYYETLRARIEVSGRVTAVLAPTPPVEAVQANARWAVGPAFTDGDTRRAVARLSQVLDRMALQAGRDTIARSVDADPSNVRWARVPSGSSTCAFCLMLASRGAAYRSRSTAGRVRDASARGPRGYIPPGYGRPAPRRAQPVGEKYHADCDCVPTPIWSGQPYPSGYDPDALYERYDQARIQAGTSSPNAILSELRKLEGIN